MVALDTSALIEFLDGTNNSVADKVQTCLIECKACLPPIVLSEILSDPKLNEHARTVIRDIPLLEIKDLYWERVGLTRATLISKGLKARIADTMIAQVCIDNDVPLITNDDDFRHFNKFFGLRLFESKLHLALEI